MDPTFKGLGVPTPSKVRSGGLNIRRALLIGGMVFGVIILISIVVNLLTPNTTNLSQRLLYRVDALTTLVDDAKSNIKNDDLGKINADLSLILTGDNAVLKKIIPTVSLNSELTAIKTEETDKSTTDSLKSALINGQYDSTYKRTLIQKVEAAKALSDELSDKASSATLKQALTNLSSHLSTYDAQLSQLP